MRLERELNIHLDPDENHCQFLDVDCHLNCQQKVPRNEMEYHLTQLCHNRRYTCQHCNFEATYDELVNWQVRPDTMPQSLWSDL